MVDQVENALMPHTLTISRTLDRVDAAVKVAIAEDGSYDHAPKLEADFKRLKEAVEDWPKALLLEVNMLGPEALDQGVGYEALVQAAEPLLKELQAMRERADARVSHSAATAANEAMGRIAELLPLMHSTTIREVLKGPDNNLTSR